MNKLSIGLMAHVNAGKTTLTEQFLYKSSMIRSLGNVDDGTAHTDFHAIEAARGISVFSAVTSFERQNTMINLIDTPGHREFAGELERCLPVLDLAVLVVSAVEGVQCHTRVIAEVLNKMQIPTVVFINKTDRMGADVESVMGELESLPGFNPINVNGTIKDGEFSVNDSELPDSISLVDEDFYERYQGEYDTENSEFHRDVFATLGRLCFDCKANPVCFGSALKDEGVDQLLDLIGMLGEFSNFNEQKVGGLDEGELCAVVYKIKHDDKFGRMAYFKVLSGKVKVRDTVDVYTYNGDEEVKRGTEKVTLLKRCYANRFEDTPEFKAGDMGVACGLVLPVVGDSFGDKSYKGDFSSIAMPLMRTEVSSFENEEAKLNAPDFDKRIIDLKKCLEILADEDNLLSFTYYNETKQMVVNLMGKIQIEILQYVLKERFGVDAYFMEPKVIYKETPIAEGYGFDAYTMPKPCWAVLKFLITPLPRGAGFEYESKVAPKNLQYRYQNHVDIAIRRALHQGLKGWEVVDLKVTLVEGGDHSIHTHPLDFFVCTPMAFMDGLRNVGTKLLEPFYSFDIMVPAQFGSRVMGELLNMRAVLESSEEIDGVLTLKGFVPVATSVDFNERLMSMTKGEGVLQLEFSHYDDAPEDCDASIPYEGVNPLDRSKFILYARNALVEQI